MSKYVKTGMKTSLIYEITSYLKKEMHYRNNTTTSNQWWDRSGVKKKVV